MTATDELRRLLDERGAEYMAEDEPSVGLHFTSWDADGFMWEADDRDKRIYLSADRLITPEQAIAATLGVGTCHDKGNIERFICSECGCRLALQDDDWEATMWLEGAAMVPRYCPNCGAKVVDE